MSKPNPSRREFVKLSAASMIAFGGMGTFLAGCGSAGDGYDEQAANPEQGQQEPASSAAEEEPTKLEVGVEYSIDDYQMFELLRSENLTLAGFIVGLSDSSYPVTDGYNKKGFETVLSMIKATSKSRDGEYASKWDEQSLMTLTNFDEFAEPYGMFFDWDYKNYPDAMTNSEKALQAMKDLRAPSTYTIVAESPMAVKVKVPIVCCTAMSKHKVASRSEDAKKAYEAGEITKEEFQSTPHDLMFEGYSHNDMIQTLRSVWDTTDETYNKTLEYTITLTDGGEYELNVDNPEWWKSVAKLTDPNKTTGQIYDLQK